MKTTNRMFVGGCMVVLVAALAACNSTKGYDRAGATVATMEQLSEELATGKTQMDTVMDTLGKIQETAETDPRPAFQEFTKAISALESTASRARSRADSLRNQTTAHYETWEKELMTMGSGDLKDQAEGRLEKARERFGKLDESLRAVGEAYDPVMAEVKDLRTYLENDMNPSGIKSASSTIKKLGTSGDSLKKKADAAIAEIEEITSAVNPKQGELPTEK